MNGEELKREIRNAYYNDDMYSRYDLVDAVEDIVDENAKLRELVNGWNFCSKTKISTFDDCVGCPLFIQTPHSYRCARDERMRELGVEVTE